MVNLKKTLYLCATKAGLYPFHSEMNYLDLLMKKFFYVLGLSLMAGLTLTSCLSDNDTENTYYLEDFFTVTGNMTSGYTLYSDNGVFINYSASNFTSSEGFGSVERVLINASYTESMINLERTGVNNPTINSCYSVPTINPVTYETAQAGNILQADSCYKVSSLTCWAYRGYLTAYTYAAYGSARPDLNLVYNPNSIGTDSLNVELCYNIHTISPTSTGNYFTSFRLEQLSELIPGTRDVTVTISCNGVETKTITVPRQDFHKGNY